MVKNQIPLSEQERGEPGEFVRLFGSDPNHIVKGVPSADDEVVEAIIRRVVGFDEMTITKRQSLLAYALALSKGVNNSDEVFSHLASEYQTALVMGYVIGRKDGAELGRIEVGKEEEL